MKIAFATGIYPPDVGGPATYIPELSKRLEEKGFSWEVVIYSDTVKSEAHVRGVARSYPPGVRHFLYFLKVLRASRPADIIYAHDATAAGFPAFLAASIWGRRFFLRLGGDVVWERKVGDRLVPVKDFYQKGLHKSFLFYLSRFVMRRAEKIILPSTILVELYERFYGILKEKLFFLQNPFPKQIASSSLLQAKRVILFAGRLQRYKNIEMLMRAFDAAALSVSDMELRIIGAGPDEKRLGDIRESLSSKEKIVFEPILPHEELLKRIANCYLAVAPSITEFSPNFALEVLAANKPVLISEEQGLGIDFPRELVFSPMDEGELVEKLQALLDISIYRNIVQWVEQLPKTWNWDNVAEEHVKLFIA